LVEDFGRPLLTVAEAARQLNVSHSAIRTLCRRGLLPYGRILNFIRLRPEDVERFMFGHDIRHDVPKGVTSYESRRGR
jgi:excisionase family DNA binding protein